MSDAYSEALQGTVHQQQLQIKNLAQQISTLNEEGLVLRQTLDQLGILRVETFLAHLHRHRFKVTRHESRFEASVMFDDLITLPELVSTIGNALTGNELPVLGTTSGSTSEKIVLHPKIYVVGGQPPDSAECFDAVAGLWQPLAPMSTARSSYTASVIAGKLYIVGGEDGPQAFNSAECFDAVAGLW